VPPEANWKRERKHQTKHARNKNTRCIGYLGAHQGEEEAAEFQEILYSRGLVLNEPIGALAHLQLGRALVMSGDAVKASAAYRDFLTLGKNADLDIPVLIAAKAEYAKLNWFRGSPFGHPVNSR